MKTIVRIDERFDRSIDAVWRAITDPQLLARWLMENDFEPTIGHKFTLREPATSGWRGVMECEVLELDPPRRMVWSWYGGMAGEAPTRVVFELSRVGKGTRLVLRHEGAAPIARGRALTAGWTRRLAALRDVAGDDYARRVAFRASRASVFDAIATPDGLRGWWTSIVNGSGARGGELSLGFEGLDEQIVMRVLAARRPQSIRWRCARHSALPEWDGTTLTFAIMNRGVEGSELHFRHEGLTPRFECFDQCEAGWDHFLESLRRFVDDGEGAPFGTRRARPSRSSKRGGGTPVKRRSL